MTTKTSGCTLTALNAVIAQAGFPKQLSRAHCETYGRKTFAYFSVADMPTRRTLEATLAAAGFTVNPRYETRAGGCSGDYPTLEVRVSYLKAKGWNE